VLYVHVLGGAAARTRACCRRFGRRTKLLIRSACGSLERGGRRARVRVATARSSADRIRRARGSVRDDALVVDISSYTDKPPSARDLRFAELLAAKRLAPEDPERVRLEGRLGTSLDVQIQRRLSFPFASLLLAVVAVPLGIRPVRSGRSMGALTAIGVMALYWMLFSVGELAAERGVGPAWLGLWLPNLIVLALSIWLVRRIARTDS
jgi:lipopolysaccharide export LptBFGC system permease protein LptF